MNQPLVLLASATLYLLPASLAEATVYREIDFPLGAASFVDEVLRYDPLFSGGPASLDNTDPAAAIGLPDARYDRVSLGRGGLIELAFVDNLQTTSGDPSPDLFVLEDAGTAEHFFLALRPTPGTARLLDSGLDANGDGYVEVGRFIGTSIRPSGFALTIDLDATFIGFGPRELMFDAVQIVDDPAAGAMTGRTVGMDLQAVGAIAAVVPEPSTALLASWPLLVATAVALGALRQRRFYLAGGAARPPSCHRQFLRKAR